MQTRDAEYTREALSIWTSGNKKKRGLSHFTENLTGRWARIGKNHFDYLSMLKGIHQVESMPMRRLLEWGPGGGSNIFKFSRCGFRHITAVDISELSLEEAARAVGPDTSYEKIIVPIDSPEDAIEKTIIPHDLFICTAVIQHVPTEHLVIRLMAAAANMMRSGGLGFVQFRTGHRMRGDKITYSRHIKRWMPFQENAFVDLCLHTGWKFIGSHKVESEAKTGYVYSLLEAY